MDRLDLKHRKTFLDNYINPALENAYIELTHPDNPTHPNQKYRLTIKGLKLKKELNQQ